MDPYLRGSFDACGGIRGRFEVGQAIASRGVGEVVASKSLQFPRGSHVLAMLPWASCSVHGPGPPDACSKMANLKSFARVPGLDLPKHMSALGSSSLSAHLALKHVMHPTAGQTAYVSGAAGSVGQVACQLLKHVYGARVLGSAGSQEKVDFILSHLGVDGAFNYNAEAPRDALRRLGGKDGVDFYFDNVGGETLDQVLEVINKHGRILCCGGISQYDKSTEGGYGIRNWMQMIEKSLRMQGFMLTDFADKMQEGTDELLEMFKQGKLQTRETVFKGMEALPKAFIGLFFRGQHRQNARDGRLSTDHNNKNNNAHSHTCTPTSVTLDSL